MSRMTDNDKTYGPLTVARWTNWFAVDLYTEDSYSFFRIIAFGFAARLRLPRITRPSHEYGVTLSKQSDRYDFVSISFGKQDHCRCEENKSLHYFLPWTQWTWVGLRVFASDGTTLLYAGRNHHKGREAAATPEAVSKFFFEDYDGEVIAATCHIEEFEWTKGDSWCSWLKYFSKPKIRRSLDLAFSAEVGTEKGSWKGGTIGHSIDMLPGETPEQAFRRYCDKEHRAKGRSFKLKFLSRPAITVTPLNSYGLKVLDTSVPTA